MGMNIQKNILLFLFIYVCTYSLYNRCVLEAEWPAHSTSSQLLWNKLRYVVLGAAHFRWAAKRRATRKLSVSTEGGE